MPAAGPVGRFARKKSKGANPVALLCNALCSKAAVPVANKIESQEAAIWLLVFYYWVGSTAYTQYFEPAWTTADSLYFLTATMTTVGYGDLTPSSRASRCFTTLWVLYGVCVVAVALVEIAGLILDARDAITAKTRAALLGSTAEAMDPAVAVKIAALKAKQASGSSQTKSSNPVTRAFQLFPILDVVLYLAAYAVGFGLLFAHLEAGWSFVDGVYYTVVTGTSVGYGDLSPATAAGRTLAVFYLPFAVVLVSTQLSEVPGKLLGNSGSGSDAQLEKLMGADLSLEGLLAMDKDGDGEVDFFEFLRHMLTQAGAVDGGVLDSLHARFQAMDEDGSGALTAEDLKVEPLGLKPTCGAGDVATKAFEWQRALAAARGQPPPKRPSAKKPGGSSFSVGLRRPSFSPSLGAGRKSLPPKQAASLSGPDVDALLAAAAADDTNDLDLEDTAMVNRAPPAGPVNPQPDALAAAGGSPRSADRFVVAAELTVPLDLEAQVKALAAPNDAADGATDAAARAAAADAQANVAVLAVEEASTRTASRRSSRSLSGGSQPGSARNSRPGSRKTSPKLKAPAAAGAPGKPSSRRASSASRGSKTPPKARNRSPPAPRAKPPTNTDDADALAAAASADEGPLV